MPEVNINHEKCNVTKCGECVDACSMEILKVNNDKIELNHPEDCNLRETCLYVCPNGAINLE
jgi:NAD-dependent dihydropyrimidine dehydrogenase PreA subunit